MPSDFRELEIAPHLLYREMASPDTGIAVAHVDLLRAWTLLRRFLGHTVRVTSGYRTPEHNRRVGGADGSQHTLGRAFDLSWQGYSALVLPDSEAAVPTLDPAFFRQLIGFGFRGVGVGRTYIHLDTRAAAPEFWSYMQGGKRVPNPYLRAEYERLTQGAARP